MSVERKKVFKAIHPGKIVIPIAISIVFVVVVMLNDARFSADNLLMIRDIGIYALLFSIPVLLLRDVGYVYRIRAITNGEVSVKGSIYTVLLWEFASAVTPSIVGGTAVAVFVLIREGVSFGRSVAFVLLTSILDNLFFVICAPLAMIFASGVIFPAIDAVDFELTSSLSYFFWVSYTMIASYTCLMVYALFVNPRAFKWILLRLTSFKWSMKWRSAAKRHGEEIVISSNEMTGRPLSYWIKITVSTIIIWTARYLLINCIAMSFMDLSWSDHLLIFARQAVLWVMMLVSITPGSSGLAEVFFSSFYYELFKAYTFATTMLWRLLSYYPYLILGGIALPRWIQRVYFDRRVKKTESSSIDNQSS